MAQAELELRVSPAGHCPLEDIIKENIQSGGRKTEGSVDPASAAAGTQIDGLQRNPGGDTDAIKAAGAAQTQGRTQIAMLCQARDSCFPAWQRLALQEFGSGEMDR